MSFLRRAPWCACMAMFPLAAALADVSASAADRAPRFSGRWVQGAMLVGQVAPGSIVRFGERELSLSPEGQFVIGLAYDAPPAAELQVIDAAGTAQRFEYSVESRQYEVQKIGGLPQGMVEPPAAVLQRIEDEQKLVANARTHDTQRPDFAAGFLWPLSAQVTGVYGAARVLNGVPKQPHFGIDLAAAEGVPVKAAAGGVVRLAAPDLYYTGGTIILDHGHGLTTTYLHLSKLNVRLGEEVKRGAVIGKVGKTGRATGPHLCWRANWFDVRLDASLLVQNEPARKGDRKK